MLAAAALFGLLVLIAGGRRGRPAPIWRLAGFFYRAAVRAKFGYPVTSWFRRH